MLKGTDELTDLSTQCNYVAYSRSVGLQLLRLINSLCVSAYYHGILHQSQDVAVNPSDLEN